jgi:hypothetical protein
VTPTLLSPPPLSPSLSLSLLSLSSSAVPFLENYLSLPERLSESIMLIIFPPSPLLFLLPKASPTPPAQLLRYQKRPNVCMVSTVKDFKED